MKLTKRQRRILEGLALGSNHYVSASEMPEFGALTDAYLVEAWMAMCGVPMWHITPAGRAALTDGERDG